MDPRDRARLDELLAERATQGLDAESRREFEALLAPHPEAVEDDRFDLAAAAIELVMLGELDEMPEDVRQRLASKGRAWARSMRRHDRRD
jgi:predicted TPR repeat methyltransferase